MTTTQHPIDQLQEIAADFRHLRGEYRHEGEQGSWRRDLGARLDELEQQFETLLSKWIPDEETRKAWHRHFHDGGPAPADDLERMPPVFVGRSEIGSQIAICSSADGDYDLIIDADKVGRAPATLLEDYQAAHIHLVDQDWVEITQSPEPALKALRQYMAAPSGEPPWQWARTLFSDGLIDVNFALTPRGRRLLKSG